MRMMRFTFFAALFFASFALFSQIDVTTQASGYANDTVLFKGITGNTELSHAVLSDLKNCGWFDVIQSGTPVYIISGSASPDGRSLRMSIANGAGAGLGTITSSGANIRSTAHKGVDILLKNLYRIPGICASKIAFVVQTGREKKEIYVCDFDGQNTTRITRNNGLSLDPVWTPDSRSIIYSFVGRTYTSLVEHRLGTTYSRKLASFSGLNAGGRVSPDGRKTALILSKDNQVDLYVRDLNGNVLRRLTHDKAVEASPCWSPDGKQICYVSDGGNAGRPRLRIISASGGASRAVSGVLGSESVSPTWSADGKIVYTAKLGNYTIAVTDPEKGFASDGGNRQKYGIIVEQGGDWESPSWAPDNRQVVCSRGGALYIVDTWTGKTRRLLGGKLSLSLPDWSKLLY